MSFVTKEMRHRNPKSVEFFGLKAATSANLKMFTCSSLRTKELSTSWIPMCHFLRNKAHFGMSLVTKQMKHRNPKSIEFFGSKAATSEIF